MNIKGLYFVTDSKLSKQGVLRDVEQVIEAGCRIVQYREKEKKTAETVAEAFKLAEMCKEKGALFLINDRLDVALAVNASGIHLGQDDASIEDARKTLGQGKVIGVTVHCVEEALQAEKDNVDYVSVSPIFHTETKKDAGKPVGVQLIKEVRTATSLPIVAIGGINEGNLLQVLEAGADSVALVSAIVCAESAKEAAKNIIGKIEGFK